MPRTLAETMIDDRVPFDELDRHYRPVLTFVETLTGVVPNCDPYLEIWQPGFRTYNLIVPNFLNLPFSLAGRGAPKDVVGLGLYVSSRAAGCAYCSAHTCSFALRRGSGEEAVTGEARTPVEAAAAEVAESLSTVPDTYRATAAALRLAHAFGPSPAEVDQATIDEASAALAAPEIVELAVWASVNQLLHRLAVRRLARA